MSEPVRTKSQQPDPDFTGMRIEPHALFEQEVCVCYRHGERVAVLYFNPYRTRLVYETGEDVWVEERTGPVDFVRVYEKEKS